MDAAEWIMTIIENNQEIKTNDENQLYDEILNWIKNFRTNGINTFSLLNICPELHRVIKFVARNNLYPRENDNKCPYCKHEMRKYEHLIMCDEFPKELKEKIDIT